MQRKVLWGLAYFALCTTACTARKFNKDELSDPSSDKPTGSSGRPTASSEIDPLHFNALPRWQKVETKAPADYPEGYEKRQGQVLPDDVFYIDSARSTLEPKATQGATAKKNLLIYELPDRPALTLKFYSGGPKNRTHAEAVKFCQSKNLRLPTAREILDFFKAGSAENKQKVRDSFGETPIGYSQPEQVWTATLDARDVNFAYVFSFKNAGGNLAGSSRGNTNWLMCVGPDKPLDSDQ
jgi:hypothetical protein